MTQEEYRAKKIRGFRRTLKHSQLNSPFVNRDEIEAFLSQTIDELWALPEKETSSCPCVSEEWDVAWNEGWNACIAEAERMRDLSIKGKR